MIDPAQSQQEFEQRVRQTPDIARLELESNPPEELTLDKAVFYRAYLSSSLANQMKQANNSYAVIKSLTQRIFNLGASEISVEDAELIIGYKQEEL